MDSNQRSQTTSSGAGFQQWIRRLSQMALLGLAMFAVPATAQQQPLDLRGFPNQDVAHDAIARLRSPYCPGFMLEVCPSPQAQALRDSIFVMAAEGASRDEIVEWMIGNHGEEWRALPKRSGASLLAWIIPPVALLAGLAAFILWLKSSHNPEPPEPAAEDGSDISGEDRDELAAALRDWESTVRDDP